MGKRIRSILSLTLGLSLPALSRAEFMPVDGYIGAGFNLLSQSAEIEKGTRSRVTIEFGRVSKNVALDLLVGRGLGYSDVGVSLKFFRPFAIPNDDSFFRAQIGAGIVGTYSSTGIMATLGDGSQSVRTFGDLGIALPDFRIVFDTGIGMALALNAGMEWNLKRTWQDSNPAADGKLRSRLYVGASLLTSSRWLE